MIAKLGIAPEPVLMYYNHMTIYKNQKVIQCMLARNWMIWGFKNMI